MFEPQHVERLELQGKQRMVSPFFRAAATALLPVCPVEPKTTTLPTDAAMLWPAKVTTYSVRETKTNMVNHQLPRRLNDWRSHQYTDNLAAGSRSYQFPSRQP